MSDGKCPDIYECRLGSDNVLKEMINQKLQDNFDACDRQLEYVRKNHGALYDKLKVRDEELRIAVELLQQAHTIISLYHKRHGIPQGSKMKRAKFLKGR